MSKIITHIEGLEKARSYCAYQERCHKEINEKLVSWGLNQDERNFIILNLLENNFLNEERFALAYAGGKFRIKNWGRLKIRQHLKLKNISEPLIKLALNQIDDGDYKRTLRKLIIQKIRPNTRLTFDHQQKIVKFLYSKGFESDLIWEEIRELSERRE